MTSGVPWEVTVRPQARETAREAARRSGMSVGEWLDSLILERTRDEGAATEQRPYADSDRPSEPPGRFSSTDERHRALSDEPFAEVNDRLATLTRRLDQLGSAGGPGPGRARRDEEAPREIADALSRLDQRLEQLIARAPMPDRVATAFGHAPPPAPSAPLDPLYQALAEIAERQRMLDGEAALPPNHLPRAPTQGFNALEQQLRDINARIDTLRPCGIAGALETLRDDLAEIGLMIKEAMPRQAIEALETEVRALAEHLDSKRNAGADAADLAGIERGLAEVRDALRALTPAENLVGFDEAVRQMSQKIDGIATTPMQDPAALEQLESAVVGLRGIVSHVASNEALAALSEDVRTLAAKVEQVAGSDLLAMLEQRIGAIADALQSRHQAGAEPQHLEAVVQGLGDKLEQLQLSRGDQTAVSHLEDRIAALVAKLDSSDARFSHLEAIERGLAELLIYLEQQRSPQPERAEPVQLPEVDLLKRDVQRTQDSIEAVHGTLGHVVDRLAMIETEIRNVGAAAQPSSTAPVLFAPPPRPAEPPRPPVAMPAPAAPSPASANPIGNPAPTDRLPIDPDLPPDHPLEPGAARARGNSPADRIAASEAALGPTRPPVIPDPGGKANFIAAARRAAQAANAEPAPRGDKQSPPAPRNGRDAKPVSKLRDRVRMLLVGASVIVIVLGSLQLATGLFSGSDNTAAPAAPDETKAAPNGGAPSPAPVEAPVAPAPAAPTAPPANPTGRQSAVLPGSVVMPVPDAGVLFPPQAAIPAVAPTTNPVSAADPLTTGSVRQPTLAAAETGPSPARGDKLTGPDKLSDKLPAAIGSAGLRAAAGKGEAAAQYEIALRYADGRGVPQDLTAAADWFERAASQGLVPAQFRLGGLYEKGMGVKRDVDRARSLYLSAAQGGNAKAMHNLAVLYAEGVDGKPDYANAAKWFRKAADHGVTDSQYNLGILFARGIGVEVNLPDAYKWLSLAAREGDRDAAKKRDDIGGRLDEQAVMTARVAVQVWTAQPQPDSAIQVATPPGGWDAVSAPPPAKRRVGADAKAPRATP